MDINWDDLNRPDLPGEYRLLDMIVAVNAADLEIWEKHPDASFELVPAPTMDHPKRYILGMADYDETKYEDL